MVHSPPSPAFLLRTTNEIAPVHEVDVLGEAAWSLTTSWCHIAQEPMVCTSHSAPENLSQAIASLRRVLLCGGDGDGQCVRLRCSPVHRA